MIDKILCDYICYQVETLKKLNNFKYCLKNVVQDDDHPSLDPQSSWIRGKKRIIIDSYFMPKGFVIDQIKVQLCTDQQFRDENEQYLKQMKYF